MTASDLAERLRDMMGGYRPPEALLQPTLRAAADMLLAQGDALAEQCAELARLRAALEVSTAAYGCDGKLRLPCPASGFGMAEPVPSQEPEFVRWQAIGTDCPFCGGHATMRRVLRDGCKDGEPDAWAYYVVCRSCAAQGGGGKSKESALRCWSQRVKCGGIALPDSGEDGNG